MAKETENKALNKEKMVQAIEYLYHNPNLGFYLIAHDLHKTPLSSLMITY